MENMTLHRGRLIDHLHLVVHEFAACKAFYGAVLPVLGVPIIGLSDTFFFADELVVSAVDGPEAQGRPTGRTHLAFQAPDRASVDAFHRAALAHGGRDNGAPGERAYHPGYYACFVLDPAGNNIEAVHHGPASRSVASVEISLPG